MAGCPRAMVHPYTLYAVALLLTGSLVFVAAWLGGRRAADSDQRWRRRASRALSALTLLAALPMLGAGCYLLWYTHRPLPPPERRALFQHVDYLREVRHQPRPLVIHLATVHLGNKGVRFLVTPGRPGSRQLRGDSTSAFLRRNGLQLAINGQIFYPWRTGLFDVYPRSGDPVNVVGLNASRGVVYAQPTERHPTLFIDREQRPHIGWTPAGALRRPSANGLAGVYQAISGTRRLIDTGRISADLDRRQDRSCQPRSAIGLDRGARRMLLMVVDGRQPNYSEGVTLRELAELLRSFGAHDAINLDGGGSSVLVAASPTGAPWLLSSPIDRRLPGNERVVANHLGVYAPPLAAPSRP